MAEIGMFTKIIFSGLLDLFRISFVESNHLGNIYAATLERKASKYRSQES